MKDRLFASFSPHKILLTAHGKRSGGNFSPPSGLQFSFQFFQLLEHKRVILSNRMSRIHQKGTIPAQFALLNSLIQICNFDGLPCYIFNFHRL